MSPNSSSIFEGEQLKPGVYKIQNVHTQIFLDVEVPTRDVCCRPAGSLGDGQGIWEIKRFGAGYTVQKFAPEEPEQFCTPVDGIQDWAVLQVCAYPVAWRVEIVDDDTYRGSGYVRFNWGRKQIRWNVKPDRSKAIIYHETPDTWQMWKLIPVNVGGAFVPLRPPLGRLEPGSLPPYETTRAQHVESERDELGTTVNEVTVVTTTTTTHRRYRVEDD